MPHLKEYKCYEFTYIYPLLLCCIFYLIFFLINKNIGKKNIILILFCISLKHHVRVSAYVNKTHSLIRKICVSYVRKANFQMLSLTEQKISEEQTMNDFNCRFP
jgi:hypothetical protein